MRVLCPWGWMQTGLEQRKRERKRERKGRLMEEHRQWDCQVASEAWHRPSIILADEHQKQREYQEWRSERKPDSKYRAAYWRCNFSRQLNAPWQECIRLVFSTSDVWPSCERFYIITILPLTFSQTYLVPFQTHFIYQSLHGKFYLGRPRLTKLVQRDSITVFEWVQ